MRDATSKNKGRKHVWKAVGGAVAFLGVGLLLTPGVLTLEPPAPSAPPSSAPVRAEDTPAFEVPKLERAGAWLDEVQGAAPVVADPFAQDRAFDCMIGPSEVADVGSAITGVLEEVLVERSDYVEAGEVVARLETTVEEATLRVAQARAERTDDILAARTNLALAKKRLKRARELHGSDALSLDRLQEVEAQHDLAIHELERAVEDHRVAKLQLEQSRAALERRTIRAPVSGVVIERLLSEGEVVDEETVVRIARIDPLRVEAILPSEWFGRTAIGELAEIVPEAPLDAPREAEVVIIDRVLDGASGTFAVELDLANAERDLPAGLRCQVRFSGRSPARDVASTERPSSPEEPTAVSAVAPD